MIDITVRLQTRKEGTRTAGIGTDLSVVFRDDGFKYPDIDVCLSDREAAELYGRMVSLLQEYVHDKE